MMSPCRVSLSTRRLSCVMSFMLDFICEIKNISEIKSWTANWLIRWKTEEHKTLTFYKIKPWMWSRFLCRTRGKSCRSTTERSAIPGVVHILMDSVSSSSFYGKQLIRGLWTMTQTWSHSPNFDKDVNLDTRELHLEPNVKTNWNSLL